MPHHCGRGVETIKQEEGADVEFRFSAESAEAGGSRLRELAAAASSVGFEMKRGRVEPSPVIPDADADGWTQYAPKTP